MNRHHVLVFTSLCEGLRLAILEAMSQAFPVITTSNTTEPDIITSSEERFIVPTRSTDAIAKKLELLVHNHRLLLPVSWTVQHKANQYSWESYQ